ncbi:MAG: sigma-70 family RNA polymerase sigma factor [Myxococcota bacterium]|nr:sigma-70 family RNA polymerase sigma factor [Myxococcota bacterium]
MSIGFVLRTFDSLRRIRPGSTHKRVPYGDLDDETLLKHCVAGDAQAMAGLVTRYERYIRTVVGKTVRKYTSHVDGTVIDDLTQEVFIGLFENECRRLRMFEGRNGCPLRAWLRVVAMRTTVSRMRRWKKFSQLPNDETDRGSTKLVDQGPTATQMLAARDEFTRKAKLINLASRLSSDDRQLIEMIYVHEMSVPEITKALKSRRGALYMRKNRALIRLRAHARAAGLV